VTGYPPGSSPAEIADRRRRYADLAEAWRRHLNADLRIAPTLDAHGWTPAHVAAIGDMATTARERDGFWRGYRTTTGSGVPLLQHLASVVTTFARHRNRSRDETLAWLAVFLGSPTKAAAHALDDVFGTSPVGQVWVPDVPGLLAPLAWAAGLSGEEALAQHRRGMLDGDSLRGMALLRGHRLTGFPDAAP
jgi:hypothetical protein